MKKLYLIFLPALFLIASTSCGDDDFELNTEKGFARCAIEDEVTDWSAIKNTQFGANLFSTSFQHFNKHGENRGILSFGRISLTPGLHYFKEATPGLDSGAVSYLTLLGDGDVIGESYGGKETNQPAWYEIEEYDPTLSFVKGRFEVMLYVGEEKSLPNSLDSIMMSNGRFEIYLE